MYNGKGRLALKTGLKSKAQKQLLLTNMAPVRGTQKPAMSIISEIGRGSFENEALENENRSTKHPNLENEAPKTRKRSTQNSKTKHPNLENEAPKTRKRSTLDRKRSTQKFDTGLSFINTRIQQECSSNLLKL